MKSKLQTVVLCLTICMLQFIRQNNNADTEIAITTATATTTQITSNQSSCDSEFNNLGECV